MAGRLQSSEPIRCQPWPGPIPTPQPPLRPREGLEALPLETLPEGPVQALAPELEEGQVLLCHGPAEVITVEGKWG